MRINLDQAREEPFHWEESVELTPAELAALDRPELVGLSPLQWRGQLTHVNPDFHLKAQLDYQQRLTCDRCLKVFSEPVSTDLELLVSVAEPSPLATLVPQTGEHQIHEEDLGTLSVPDEVLDTDPLLREQLQLSFPMKPLCRPECQGLCPICGADRNLGDCGCEEHTTDPRWAALAALRDRLPDKS